MAKAPRENRVPIMMSEAELRGIDDWRFANRIATRSDAVRRLSQMSLSIDASLEKIYRKTKALYETLLTRQETVSEMVNEQPVDWKKVATLQMTMSTELIELVMELQIAGYAMTAQVMTMRGEGEIPDLRQEAERIKAEASKRAKMMRLVLKAAEAGELDDEDDE